ncbi:hypothetical protein B1J93_09485 [Leptospira kirschneri serovar Pomona]|uniref:Uncharacterized protein n=1 Tax=Leptospira kirschneri serovar Pomona TaxID=561005 RepID=A0A1T1DP63_9LEPT|nr:hypothetical protein [Leptospira kirschneri]OOV42644.1 hypothetical protein B1J93_09485 [Leptospira kirschneri serovar Pomona]
MKSNSWFCKRLFHFKLYLEDRAEIGVINAICKSDSFVNSKVNQTISEMNRFWPFEGANDTEWKRRISQMSCN